MELRWTPSRPASCFHAARLMLAGRQLVDPALAAALGAPAAELRRALATQQIAEEAFFTHLVPLSATGGGPLELARTTLAKAAGPTAAVHLAAHFADLLRDLRRAFDAALPQLEDQLPLRVQPIRMQWEARGGGLWVLLRRLTDEDFLASSAEVVLVQPVTGGGGAAYAAYNRVVFEAVLADALPTLPEILRLAWLVAQLNLDLPRYSEQLSPVRSQWLGALAAVPLVLYAGEQLELARADEATTRLALETWGMAQCAGADAAQTLGDWWQVYITTRPTPAAALTALDRMLG